MIILGIASLMLGQNQTKQIPSIDWSNLPYQQQMKQMADGWLAKYHLPGVWVALIKDGKVVACVATGVKNLETGAPALVTDRLNVGSVSKVITGMLLAQFVAKGTIRYNTTIGEVFPDLANVYSRSPLLRVTLGQLLTHTSGLPKRVEIPPESEGQSYRFSVVKKCLALDNLSGAGHKYLYSNLGCQIAVAMVERLSGTKYESWFMSPSGKALGLDGVTLLDTDNRTQADISPYYDQGGVMRPGRIGAPYLKFEPSGGCSLTLASLCKFATAVIDNKMGLPEDVFYSTIHFEKIADPSHPCTSASWEGSDKRYLYHSGSTGRGEVCRFWVSPSRKAALAFYTNCAASSQGEISANETDNAKALLEDLSKLRLYLAPLK